MKNFLFLSIIISVLLGCNENSKNPDIKQKDSICVATENNSNSIFGNDKKTNSLIIVRENQEDMIDISDLFSDEELDKIRYNFIRQLHYTNWGNIQEWLSLVPTEEWNGRNEIPKGIEITDKEKSDNMDVIYHILLKKYPIFKPVSKELFEEKMKNVFNIDVNDNSVCGSMFYTNHRMDEKFGFTIYIDLKNRIVTLGNLPVMFKEDINWDVFYKKLENIDQESVAYYDANEKLYEEYLSEAFQKKYTIYCSKQKMEYLFHINNYVFHDSKASLSWLLNNTPDCIDTPFSDILFEFFNYDKEPRINKNNFRFDISKGFPLKSDRYKSLFGEVESCSQTQYYNHFKFKVRTGMMQYVVDNCYDETDLDTFGIRKDKLICIMEDCFDYLFEYVLKGDEYKESEGKYYEGQYGHYESYGCHYYQVCAYLAYYLTKAHEKFVSYGHGDPRCWHNALVNNLREDLKNNDARFENYVKENNYFNLEGFEQIMKDVHDQAMVEQ